MRHWWERLSFLRSLRTQFCTEVWGSLTLLTITRLKSLFKPELLKRIDAIIPFHTLEPEHLREIVDLMIAQTPQRLAAQSIELQVTDAARSLLVEHVYDPAYGALPLRRTVQHMPEDLLAESILQNTLTQGDTVAMDAIDGKLTMRPLAIAQSSASGGDDKGQQEVA